MVLYDVMSEQLGGAMIAVAEKLVTMEKEGLLREGVSVCVCVWGGGGGGGGGCI